MKQTIHPQYHSDAIITCACGNKITTGSVKPKIEVMVCSACHPFYTGAHTFVDTQGRIELFRAKQKAAKKTPKKSKVVETGTSLEPKSLKEMLKTN